MTDGWLLLVFFLNGCLMGVLVGWAIKSASWWWAQRASVTSSEHRTSLAHADALYYQSCAFVHDFDTQLPLVKQRLQQALTQDDSTIRQFLLELDALVGADYRGTPEKWLSGLHWLAGQGRMYNPKFAENPESAYSLLHASDVASFRVGMSTLRRTQQRVAAGLSLWQRLLLYFDRNTRRSDA